MKTNRGMRFLFSFLFLILASVISFMIVKSTVDWATYSKTEMNRQRDSRCKFVVDQINEKFGYIRRTE